MNNSFFQDIWAQRKAWLLFIPFMLFYAASYFQRTAIPGTTFTIFQSTYGLNAAEIAGLASSFVLVYSFCQLLVGMLADKFGGLRLVTVAGAIFCVGVLGFPFSCGNLTLMYICRFLTGLGASTLYLSLVKESERIFGRKNFAVILGIIYFIGYGGGLFGTLPFALFCEKFKWIPLLISVGVISTLLYLWFLAARKCVPISPIKKTTQFFLQPLFSIIKNPLSWMIVYCSSVNFACNSVIQMIFGKKMLQDTAGIDDTGAAAVIFFQVLVCMFALLSGGIQTRITRNRRKPLMIFSTVLALLNTLMMYAAIRFHLP